MSRLAFAAFGLAVLEAACARPAAQPRPDVLLVTLDTTRADHIGCYGYAPAETPQMDALARRGARFATAVASTPLTAPSHASILTGLDPPRHGVRDNGRFPLASGVATLAEAFRRAGYRTGAFVSGFPLDHRFAFDRGFDRYDDLLPHGGDARRAPYVERTADLTTERALQFWPSSDATPTFAWVHYFDPHAPYEAPAPVGARFAKSPYDGEIAFVDAQLGRLLAAASARPALVLVTADHGEGLGDHGETTHGLFVYDTTLRVPFVLAGPGVAAGIVPKVTARGIDVAPTLLELAGLPPLAGVDGRSLREAADGRALEEAPAYAESLFGALNLGWAPLHAWRTGKWKLIDAPRSELYDVASDPGELADRSADEARLVEELRQPLRAVAAREAAPAVASVPPEAAEQLRALGYLGGTQPAGSSSGRDPKDGLALLRRLELGLAEARSDPRRAIAELSAVLAQEPRAALALRYRAIAFQQAGRHSAALRDLDTLETLGPPSLDDSMLRAEALRLSGRGGEALPVLDAAAGSHPGAPEPELFRGRVLRGLGRTGEAVGAYEAALSRSPDHIEARRGLAELALERGDTGEAARRYAEILSRDALDVGALARLGVVRAREGRIDEALPLLQQAASLDPNDAEAALTLAGALAKLGRAGEAIAHFERALAAGGETTLALNGLAIARLETGDTRGAASVLRRSLAVDPRQPQIAELLARLGS